jgi:maltooligosyltrehalose trehalohydrolase
MALPHSFADNVGVTPHDATTFPCSPEQAPVRAIEPRDFPLGGSWKPDGTCTFLVWAPQAKGVEVRVLGSAERTIEMQPLERGYFFAWADAIQPGTRYRYALKNEEGEKERPDPASRFQPEGIHGPSEIVDARFGWSDEGWRGIALDDYVIYELHIGTFTPEGTFDAAISRLQNLKELGIAAIEIMPVAQFPGARNWGYDGVYAFAVQDSYGGPTGFKRLVDACHAHGIAVLLDVVYNHFGPEGNYTADFGNYSTDSYKTPWGDGMNFDGPLSDEVRRYFTENALMWVGEYHIDGLRLDAIHAIVDTTAEPFLAQLTQAVHARAEQLQRQIHLIAESDRDNRRVLDSTTENGFGFDAVWNDDFHHSLHVMLTGEREGYFQDFCGGVQDLAQAWREGFVYTGQYSPYRKHHHGSPSRDIPGKRFIVFTQNHDQVGNRTVGERISHLVSFEKAKLAAGTVLLSPYVPMIFMGEEYMEDAPFQYFVSYADPALIQAVHEGRKSDFEKFEFGGDHPDPGSEEAFVLSKLNWEIRDQGCHAILFNLYRELLRLRREVAALAHLDKDAQEVVALPDQNALLVQRWHGESRVCVGLHFGDGETRIPAPLAARKWRKVIDSADARWGGPESAAEKLLEGGDRELRVGSWAFVLYVREE